MSYEGSGLPGWISSPRNPLRELHLVELNELPTLPPLGKLRSLERLSVTKLMKMKILGREFLGLESSSSLPSDGVVDAFPRLQMLAFIHLPEWEKWEDITTEEYAADVSIMPHLTEYSSIWCKGTEEAVALPA